MAMHVTVDTLLERVKAIAPMLRASAAEAEAQRRLARPVVDAMLRPCQLIACQPDHQARRDMTASSLSAYAAVGRLVTSCQIRNLFFIS